MPNHLQEDLLPYRLLDRVLHVERLTPGKSKSDENFENFDFPGKAFQQGSLLVSGPLVLRPYSRTVKGLGFISRKNTYEI